MRSVLEFHVQINHPRGKAEGSSIWNVAYWQTNSRNHIELKCFVVIYVFLGMHPYTLHGNQWFGHDNFPGGIFVTATLNYSSNDLSYPAIQLLDESVFWCCEVQCYTSYRFLLMRLQWINEMGHKPTHIIWNCNFVPEQKWSCTFLLFTLFMGLQVLGCRLLQKASSRKRERRDELYWICNLKGFDLIVYS